MNYEEMADDLARFLDMRGLERIALVGHNIGGKTAMTFAGMYPERVKGFVCFDTAPVSTPSDKV